MQELISDYIVQSKYARYLPKLQRRETYEEIVERVEDMHVCRFPVLEKEIRAAFDLVRQKRVLPSMRSMQFAGEAIKKNNLRQYNCSFAYVDSYRRFDEALYLLLCGVGTGYSVQKHHVDRLPMLQPPGEGVYHHEIADSIEGWAEALRALVESYVFDFPYVEFNYSKIRPAGALLKTSGGRAPGHKMLKQSLERIRRVLDRVVDRSDKRLVPYECHTIMCHAADAVLSGGIRRSAMIALFSPDDAVMLECKANFDWFSSTPWLANANNSAVLLRDETSFDNFSNLIKRSKVYGEPGFYFTESREYGTNPCAEIGLYPTLETGETGWAFCNLTEINAAVCKTEDELQEAAHAATLIGTLQAAYTDFPYLGAVSEEIAKRDALLGVSMTGMCDNPDIAFDSEIQERVAGMVRYWNMMYADFIGINQAKRTTCVKPAGTSSLVLGCVASGIHPHHAKRYIRRVQAVETEHVFQAYRAVNPHACVRKPDGKWVVEFAIETPDGAVLRGDVSAVDFLTNVLSTQNNWVLPGGNGTDLNHNVSNTCTVRPDEWNSAIQTIWYNSQDLTGVSLLADTGDQTYAFAPLEEVKTFDQYVRWNELRDLSQPVDYSQFPEGEDGTARQLAPACAGGVCEL